MKKISFGLSLMLLVCMMVPGVQAASDVQQETTISYTECGDFEMTITTIHYSSLARRDYGVDKVVEVKSGGKVIAKVTLSASFDYDGKTAWVTGASGSHTTYDGWTYNNEKITKSGGTAKLTATLSHSKYGNVPVSVSLTCSPTGQIS